MYSFASLCIFAKTNIYYTDCCCCCCCSGRYTDFGKKVAQIWGSECPFSARFPSFLLYLFQPLYTCSVFLFTGHRQNSGFSRETLITVNMQFILFCRFRSSVLLTHHMFLFQCKDTRLDRDERDLCNNHFRRCRRYCIILVSSITIFKNITGVVIIVNMLFVYFVMCVTNYNEHCLGISL